jgi:uncharacterized protein (UPF0297 family)
MDYILLSRAMSQNKEDHFTDTIPNISETHGFSFSDIKSEIEEDIKNRLENPLQSAKTKYSQLVNNIVGIIISCVSAYLAWTCNSKMSFGKRLSMTILAFLFGMFYLVYAISFITTMCSNDGNNVTVTAISAPSG